MRMRSGAGDLTWTAVAAWVVASAVWARAVIRWMLDYCGAAPYAVLPGPPRGGRSGGGPVAERQEIRFRRSARRSRRHRPCCVRARPRRRSPGPAAAPPPKDCTCSSPSEARSSARTPGRSASRRIRPTSAMRTAAAARCGKRARRSGPGRAARRSARYPRRLSDVRHRLRDQSVVGLIDRSRFTAAGRYPWGAQPCGDRRLARAAAGRVL